MILALDLGTSALKAALVDRDGRVVAQARADYQPENPFPDASEIDPDRWWRALHQVMTQFKRLRLDSVSVVGFSGQMHGVVLCDAALKPLRPAILWLDARASGVLKRFETWMCERLGNPASAGMAAATLLWLRQHEPELYARARWALQPKDWLRARLGGEIATDASDATGTLMANLAGEWDTQVLDALQLRRDWLPPVRDSHAIAGTLAADVAAELGLPANVPLVVGAADTACAALGNGLLHPGQGQLNLGTGVQILVVSATAPAFNAALNAHRTANPHPHAQWYAMAAMLNAGSALDWMRRLLQLDWPTLYAMGEQGQADGVTFTPYLNGERTPLMDARATGGLLHLRSHHTRESIVRAAFEGVAASLRAGMDVLRSNGHSIHVLQLSGGGASAAWWIRYLAEVLECKLRPQENLNASVRGAALLAGIAMGYWQASGQMSVDTAGRT